MTDSDTLLTLLNQIYGSETARPLWDELRARLGKARLAYPLRKTAPLTNMDAMLISYGDQVTAPGYVPLESLADFCDRHLDGLVSCLHILPFYPSSSDDGFAVKDYRQVDPALGGWEEIARLGEHRRLMFDAVINHASARGAWFRAFLRDEPPYNEYFISVSGSPDLSQVVRPRALPLLTRFGDQDVWTTFSADQVDLNFANPRVLLEIIDLLLFYAAKGAEFIRLDAIAYLWKEPGTSCIHHPNTHRIIQLFRAALDEAAPHVRLITETNVPHLDNIAYFGDGSNEAQLVYNFALPPLVLHTLQSADASALSRWAAGLRLPSEKVTFFNFLASHDGIGLNPLRGILPESEIIALVQRTLQHGGRVNYKHNPDGSQSPYELNINYFDALSDPQGDEPLETQVGRFMAAQAILLSLVGLPGLYFHSLFGSRGWQAGPELTGMNRSINRQKLTRAELEKQLSTPGSLRAEVFRRYAALLRARASCEAFDPFGTQTVLDCSKPVFALLRQGYGVRALCLQNVSSEHQSVAFDLRSLPGDTPNRSAIHDLLTGAHLPASPRLEFAPYQSLWLALED
ncbi:MAG TPA: sugar phosphorylase [Anaerolineales bacterium]|jgi:sucrose phosphorylase